VSGRPSNRIDKPARRFPVWCALSAATGADYVAIPTYPCPAHGGVPMKPNNKLGSHSVATLRTMVSARDLAILRSIHDHKFLTTTHLRRLHFWDHATISAGTRACTRVLTRLKGHRLIYRLVRQIGGISAGSGAYVWGIDAAGDRLLKSDLGEKSWSRSRAYEPTPPFLDHCLAVAELRVQLEDAVHDGRLESVQVTTEPANWREYLDRSGAPAHLKPDLHAITTVGDFEDHWFIEIDRGTESMPRLHRKSLRYQWYFSTGREQAQHRVFPVVAWILDDARRRHHLEALLAGDHRFDRRLFVIASVEEFLAAITSLPDGAPSAELPTGR
jgi:Replication-relaxation